ncbi:MAG: AAA family ATPase [Patescibacteria group bacterium]
MLIGHKKQWEFLKNKFERDQLSHAYLFTGQEGLGKKIFAKNFVELIGCKFPDLMVVEPEGGKEISIAKIREVQNFLAYKSYNGGFKVVIVNDAHLMNQEAQNCFLKTLEEPKGKTILILVTSKPEMLLPTIFSRCQTIKFLGRPVQDPKKIDEENKILQDALKVVRCELSEKFKYAKSIDFEKQNAAEIVEVLQKYLRHLLMVKIGINKPDQADENFLKYSAFEIKKIINLTEEILNKLLFTNANPKLALEILLMDI